MWKENTDSVLKDNDICQKRCTHKNGVSKGHNVSARLSDQKNGHKITQCGRTGMTAVVDNPF